MKRYLIGLLVVFLIISFTIKIQKANLIKAAELKTAREFHKKGWTDTVEGAYFNKYDKYGIYASRIMAVSHPEIYLKADLLTLRSLDEQSLMTMIRFENGYDRIMHKFSLEKIQIGKYKTHSIQEVYPDNIPLYNFLDRRIFPVTTVLRSKNDREIVRPKAIQEIEKAHLFYGKQKYIHDKEDMFVIYCADESTYVELDGKLYSMKDFKIKEEVDGKPILIYNEESVWYPLMERDDTDQAENLKEVVFRYKRDDNKPDLSNEETGLVTMLKRVSQLEGNQQSAALLAAAQLSSAFSKSKENELEEVLALWKKLFPNFSEKIIKKIRDRGHTGLDNIILSKIIVSANRLSPLIAKKAFIKAGSSSYKTIEGYFERNYQYNQLWGSALHLMTIDQAYVTHSGKCTTFANGWSAVFDLLESDYITFYGGSHAVVYLQQESVLISNFSLIDFNQVNGSIDPYSNISPLFYVSTPEGWGIIIKNKTIGNLTGGKYAEIVKNIDQSEHFDLKGYKERDSYLYSTSLEEIIEFLEGEPEIKGIKLP